MQNEPKSRKVKFNVTKVLSSDYEQMDTWSIRKNEPKTNPNEPKTNPVLAQKTTLRIQTNPKQTQFQRVELSMLLSIMVLAAAIIFSEFSVLVLTSGPKSRKLPLLYFPVVLNRLFEGIS
jgi:hypothetical protein